MCHGSLRRSGEAYGLRFKCIKMHIHKKETSYIEIQFSKIRKQIGNMWVSLLTQQVFAVCLITTTVSKKISIRILRYLQQL